MARRSLPLCSNSTNSLLPPDPQPDQLLRCHLWICKASDRSMAKVGRHLWRVFNPTPPVKQGHLEQLAQDTLQSGFEYFQDWRILSFSEQPIPVSDDYGAKVFLVFKWHSPCFILCPSLLVLSLNTAEKSLVPSSLYSAFRYLQTQIRFSLSLLFSRLNSSSSFSFFSCERCSTSLIILVTFC